MVKGYYLTFGAFGDAEEIAEFIHDSMGVSFQQVGDFFRGWHYHTLVYVSANFSETTCEWLEFEDQEFAVIIYVHTVYGRNKDRLSEHKWFKGWLSRYDKLTLISEEILEECEPSDSQ